tara:strand:- start:242 stop:448 length:207 start_codon:yes stop_codon:yes gene_type:complete
MIVKIDVDRLAIALAHKKVEKKYTDLKIDYYTNNYNEFSSFKYTKESQKDFDKFYKYFYNIIIENKTL